MKNRWTANKFGLFNFWYYDNQEFELSSGKILLRGTNGSGKSVTTQSFIPLILDGNKHPRRLDPFGSSSRRVEDYIIYGEYEDRISYLYMEFKKPNSETYITIGIGLRGRKGKPLESWYFILKDGRRINVDFKLYEGIGEKLPLTRDKFKNRLGNGNIFTTKQGEYKQKVNEHLFGYSDIEDYDQLLNLLIEIRSPKLSKDFKPTKIYEILKLSLKTLSDNDLIPMAEAMDNMDRLNEALDQSYESMKSCEKIKKVFDDYNNHLAYIKSLDYVNGEKRLRSISKEKKDIFDDIENAKIKNINDRYRLIELEEGLEKANIEYENLKENEIVKVKEELEKLKRDIKIQGEDLKQEEILLEEKQGKRRELEISIGDLEKSMDGEKHTLSKELHVLEELSKEVLFEDGYNLKSDVLKDIENYEINNIRDDLNIYTRTIKTNKRLIEEYEVVKIKYDEKLKKYDNLERSIKLIKDGLNESVEYLTNIKEEFIEKLNVYNVKTEEFKLTDRQLKELVRKINDIEKEEDLIDIGTLDIYGSLKNKINLKIDILIKDIKDINLNIKEIMLEIESLNSQKEIELPISSETLENREILLEKKIPHISFSKAFDFKEAVSEEEKAIIETSLLELGIIDGLIIPNEHRLINKNVLDESLNDKYLICSSVNDSLQDESISTLYDYLEVVENDFSNKYSGDLINILKSIIIDEDSEMSIYMNGKYRLGLLQGKISKDINSKYIGEVSRQRYREELIKDKEEQIELLNVDTEKLNDNIENLKIKVQVLEKEYKEFPSTEDIKSNILEIKEMIYKLNKEEDENLILKEKLRTTEKSIETIKSEIFEKTRNIDIENSVQGYTEAIELLEEYSEQLLMVPTIVSKIKLNIHLVRNNSDYLEDLSGDIDKVFRTITSLKQKIRNNKVEIDGLREVLSNSNLGQIEQAIERVINIRNKNPEEIKCIRDVISKSEQKIETDKEKLEEKEQVILREESIKKLLYSNLEKELSLNYIDTLQGNTSEKAKGIISQYKVDDKKDINTYLQALTQRISENTGSLRDYNIRQMNIFVPENDFEKEELKKISKQGIRTDIILKYSGKNISLYEMIDALKSNIDLQKMMIGDEERNIFEEILINTISSKITSKIYQTQQWIDSMNNLMESMNTSNGIKFNIKWKPKRTTNDTQVDISKLVNILKAGQRVSEEDIKLLSNHFKSSLKIRKRENEESRKEESYQSIIKDILDYREWYDFILYCTKPLEGKKEMTDNEFFKLSGGEKAMAMYVPLFAAVNARYNSADKKDCPRLLALDEAFAGVDENNINDMFKLIESLDLDYILNSQVLWGDYQSVKTLAIYELIRGKEDDIVSVIPYAWNGKEKNCFV